jgi:hypothetical protein
MLLICQSVPALFRGSHPFFRATVACSGTPPDTPQRCDGVTFSISRNASLRSAFVRSRLGPASWRSSAIWSVGMVVVRPHPGHGNPAHSTHADGEVSSRPAAALNDRIAFAPPTVSELPRVFRTGNLRLIHATSCPFRYSSMTSCGVR